MIKEDAIIILVGVIKDTLRLALGIYLYGLDLEVTGRFFAELAPTFIVLGWAENVDSEFILDPESKEKNRTNYYIFLGLLLIFYHAIISSELFFFAIVYFSLRIGYMYYKTEMLELNEHSRLMRQKLIEILLLSILLGFHSYMLLEWVICIFIVIPAIPSLMDGSRFSSYFLSMPSQFPSPKLKVAASARSVSLIVKNVVGNLDVMALAYINPEGAGLIKYVKSLGNGQNLIVNQFVERYRKTYIKTLIESRRRRKLLILTLLLLCFGLLFGVLIINILLPLLGQFIAVPELPLVVTIYFMLLAVSPIMRITYLYSSNMKINVIAQLLIVLVIVLLFYFGQEESTGYLILPVMVGFTIFVTNIITLK